MIVLVSFHLPHYLPFNLFSFFFSFSWTFVLRPRKIDPSQTLPQDGRPKNHNHRSVFGPGFDVDLSILVWIMLFYFQLQQSLNTTIAKYIYISEFYYYCSNPSESCIPSFRFVSILVISSLKSPFIHARNFTIRQIGFYLDIMQQYLREKN